jgi:hypothetical protein
LLRLFKWIALRSHTCNMGIDGLRCH